MKTLQAAVVLCALMSAGCSGEDSKSDSRTKDLSPPPEGKGAQLSLAWRMEPGDEKTNCGLYVVPAVGEGPYLTAFEHRYSENASHHLLLYTTSLTEADAATFPSLVENCAGLEAARLGVLYGAQSPSGSVKMPADVGLAVPGGTVLLFEFHAINSSTAAVDAQAKLNLEYTNVKPAMEAGVLFHYNATIHVPAMASAKAGMTCRRPIDMNLLQVGSHMHARGIGFSAWLTDASGGNQPLYETADWEEPSGGTFDPPLRLSTADTIEFECHYENKTSKEFFQGLSASEDEMCILTGLYYADPGVPRMAGGQGSPEWCGNGADGSRARQFGTGGCTAARTCLEEVNAAVGRINPFTTPREWYQKWQGCFADSTDDAALRLTVYRDCRNTACTTTCETLVPGVDGGADLMVWDFANPQCQTCITTNCAAEIAACDAD